MPKLKIGDSVAKLPIIQGGLGIGISLSGLSSAVANEGGIGVIAAGGVFTLTDIYSLFKLRASGVQMGTRFVATHKCDADIRFKESYVSCREDDIEIIKSPVGLPGRAIRSRFSEDASSGKKMELKCAWKCLNSCDIKTEYLKAVGYANFLKDEPIRLFEHYSLFNRPHTKEI